MNKHIASTVTSTGILLFIGSDRYAVGNDHPNFGKIKDAIARKDYEGVADLIDIRSAVRKWMASGHEFTLTNDLIELNGVPFSDAVTDKVLAMIDAGNDADPLFNFLRKVRSNPSATAQSELFLFCVANGFMIHEDGDLIAYKSVRGDYTDLHSGRVSNHIGAMPSMDRFLVDDNRAQTCSRGLHFASFDYASSWAGAIDGVSRRLIVMKIHPRDVVSIPHDYDNQKGRCCCYEVIAELGGTPLPKREVYTDSDLGRGTLDNDSSRIDEINGELEELYDRACELNDRIINIEDAINAFDVLGKDDGELFIERDSYQLELDDVNDDIARLEDELEELPLPE
jgi:hypothetical protein